MKKSMKIMFQNAPRHIRRTMVQAIKNPPNRVVMDRAIGKPLVITQTDGKVVPYTGP